DQQQNLLHGYLQVVALSNVTYGRSRSCGWARNSLGPARRQSRQVVGSTAIVPRSKEPRLHDSSSKISDSFHRHCNRRAIAERSVVSSNAAATQTRWTDFRFVCFGATLGVATGGSLDFASLD